MRYRACLKTESNAISGSAILKVLRVQKNASNEETKKRWVRASLVFAFCSHLNYERLSHRKSTCCYPRRSGEKGIETTVPKEPRVEIQRNATEPFQVLLVRLLSEALRTH